MERIKCLEEQVETLKNNQEHVIEAFKNLNDRFGAIEGIIDVGQLKDAKNIVESQAMIDELIVKNADDIKILQEWKKRNLEAIQNMDQEIKTVKDMEIKIMENIRVAEKDDEFVKLLDDKCRYWDRGYCKYQKQCKFEHPMATCEIFLKEGKCKQRTCEKRHPISCYFWKGDGCNRGKYCAYLHLETELKLNLKKCDRCMKVANQTYFCDFCGMNFCFGCTTEEAHDENFDKFRDIIDCKQIHESLKDSDVNENADDKENEEPQTHEMDNNECKECTYDDKCVPCIMSIAREDLDTSYGSYELEDESIETLMAKAKAFDDL